MPTVTISSTDYDVYISQADANAYLAGQFTATAWRAETDEDQKDRAIISATRFIDRQLWQGEKTDAAQLHAFPRTGLYYRDSGEEVDDALVPQEVIYATAELASIMLSGSDVQENFTPGNNLTQSFKAGSVAISYFRGEWIATRLPTIIQELLGFWLAASALAISSGAIATGVDRESQFEDTYDFNQGI